MPQKKFLIVIAGPTASGKTKVAIKLAKYFDTEIISADSRQFYREMEIGTAKPTETERNEAKHHFVDFMSIHDAYSVGDFEKEVLELLEELYQKHQVVILAGGSGLFVRAVCEGLDEFPDVSPEIRAEVNALFKEKGLEALQEELQKVDPAYYDVVDKQNPMRLLRAIEVFRASGKPYSSFRKAKKATRPFTPIYIQLDTDRLVLYERINLRVDQMIQQGLIEEVRQLLPFKDMNALQTVGYQELFDYFDEKITKAEAIELIKRNSRRYAKRQMTWLRKDLHWVRFSIDQLNLIKKHIKDKIADRSVQK